MILYYAMGGGLGHLARSLAILSAIDPARPDIRVLASSRLAAMVASHLPCPMDVMDVAQDVPRQAYHQWLEDYLHKHQVSRIVLDCFAWGIVGEWCSVGQSIPKDLIARSLTWSDYQSQVSGDLVLFPQRVLVIEPLATGYESVLKRHSQVTYLQGPICLSPETHTRAACSDQAKVLVVHSGSLPELEQLVDLAQRTLPTLTDRPWAIHQCIPPDQVYPAQERFSQYDYIVSGAGYNMIAQAWSDQSTSCHLFSPFARRYDDQATRLEQYQQGTWLPRRRNAAKQAAAWLMAGLD